MISFIVFLLIVTKAKRTNAQCTNDAIDRLSNNQYKVVPLKSEERRVCLGEYAYIEIATNTRHCFPREQNSGVATTTVEIHCRDKDDGTK